LNLLLDIASGKDTHNMDFREAESKGAIVSTIDSIDASHGAEIMDALRTPDGLATLKRRTVDDGMRELAGKLESMELTPKERSWASEMMRTGTAKGMGALMVGAAILGTLGSRRSEAAELEPTFKANFEK